MNRKIVSTCALVALAFVSESLTAEKEKTIAEFRAFAINMQGGPMTNAGVVEIGLWGWSTEADRDMLITTLQEKGSDALLNALTSLPPLGYIRMPNTLGWSIYYARQTDMPDGSKKIVMATNRKLLYGEVARQTRSAEYDFTLLEIHFKKGSMEKGEGKLAAAAKVTFDNKTHKIEIENYEAMPVQLKDVSWKVPK